MKVIINRCRGYFNLSDEAINDLNIGFTGFTPDGIYMFDDEFRSYPPLIALMEEKGKTYVEGIGEEGIDLRIVEIPNNTNFRIKNRHGMETLQIRKLIK